VSGADVIIPLVAYSRYYSLAIGMNRDFYVGYSCRFSLVGSMKENTMATQNTVSKDFISTGIPGLDYVLGGGLTKERLYLLEGDPGSGKTTMALQFLIEGVRRGEKVLYITLAENNVELRAVADAHGFSLDGVTVHEVIPEDGLLDPAEQYTVLHPSEVELGETNNLILEMIEKLCPTRVVLDSL